VAISVRTGVGRFLGRLALFGVVLLGLSSANAQNAQLDAALARVKLTDLSARPCDPKAVWRFDIVDPESLNSWRSFLDATNPIISKILYSGCDGIQTLVADIQFNGHRIAVAQLATNYDEHPRVIVRDPVLLERYQVNWQAERLAVEDEQRARYEKVVKDAEERNRPAYAEAARLRAEAERKKELEISQAMQPDGSGLAPYHILECHPAAGKPRSTSNLSERDICEAIFRAGLSNPDAIVYPSNVSCQVTHKRGEIPLARCRYDYKLYRVTDDPVLAGSANFGMPTLFYFDILRKQWEPNGNQLKDLYAAKQQEIRDRNRPSLSGPDLNDPEKRRRAEEGRRERVGDCVRNNVGSYQVHWCDSTTN